MEKLKVGDTVKVPNVLPFKIEDLHEGFVPANPAFANRKVFVDTKERFLLIYDDKQLVAEFPITPGSTHPARAARALENSWDRDAAGLPA